MEDLISIIVPVYNVEEYIDRCLESMINQTYKNLEIILVDDGSTDNSGKKCDEWTQKDNRIKVFHKENGGVSTARNLGLEKVRGRYVGFVDPDDYVNENMYEIMHKEIKKNNADLVICDFNIINKEEQLGHFEKEENKHVIINKNEAILVCYPENGYVWKGLFTKKRLENIKFNEQIWIAEDLNFICNYILNCKNSIVYIKEKLYHYIVRKNSTMTKVSKNKRLEILTNLIETIKITNLMIKEKCNDLQTISIVEKRTIRQYWLMMHLLINEKLITNKELTKRYYVELKKHNKYFLFKDKIYLMALKISPSIFDITYKIIRKIKIIARKMKVKEN